MTPTEPLVLPIGQFFGTLDGTPTVRSLGEVHRLEEPRFGAWALLHGVPDKLVETAWTRAVVRDLATGIDPIVDGLLADGLAAEVAPGTDASVGFARAHRMGHRMLGLGNTPDEPWLFSIGLFDQPVVRVTREVFDLWDVCELAESLWVACESVAPDDPAGLLEGFLATVHHLLTMSVVYLEPRR